jgi:hypothetical protein
MTTRMPIRVLLVAGLAALAAAPLAAQEFIPPDRVRPQPAAAAADTGGADGFRLEILGFSTRGGAQVNKGGQAILGSTIDIAQLGSRQVRLRPSFEVGFGRSSTSLAFNLEVVYRFQPDGAAAIPYLGIGAGYHDDTTVKRVWPTVAMGFELPFSRNMNWLIEYHALDGLRRSRFLVGLATRGGG